MRTRLRPDATGLRKPHQLKARQRVARDADDRGSRAMWKPNLIGGQSAVRLCAAGVTATTIPALIAKSLNRFGRFRNRLMNQITSAESVLRSRPESSPATRPWLAGVNGPCGARPTAEIALLSRTGTWSYSAETFPAHRALREGLRSRADDENTRGQRTPASANLARWPLRGGGRFARWVEGLLARAVPSHSMQLGQQRSTRRRR